MSCCAGWIAHVNPVSWVWSFPIWWEMNGNHGGSWERLGEHLICSLLDPPKPAEVSWDELGRNGRPKRLASRVKMGFSCCACLARCSLSGQNAGKSQGITRHWGGRGSFDWCQGPSLGDSWKERWISLDIQRVAEISTFSVVVLQEILHLPLCVLSSKISI